MHAAGPHDAEDDAAEPSRDSLRGQVTHGRTVQAWIDDDPRRAQRISRLVAGPLLRVALRARGFHADRVPGAGPFLLCPNHSSWLDGFIQVMHQHRCVHIMGKSEIFQLPIVPWYARHVGAFPVVRGAGDLRAREIARSLLERGEPVAIYPEGTRKGHRPGHLGRPRSGAALLALQTGAPVVPVASVGIRRWGEHRRLHWPRTTTIYGAPIHPEGAPTRERVAQLRDRIWDAVRELHHEAEAIHEARRWW